MLVSYLFYTAVAAYAKHVYALKGLVPFDAILMYDN